MSLGILTNISNLYAQRNLGETQGSLQKTLTGLSSGSRLNSGGDDAAGLSVADGLHANVAALTQSARNASDGTGLLQTADGGLSQVTNLLNRVVTLATETANGTLNASQVSAANQEYQKILAEIGVIGSTTEFNGNPVFTGTGTTVFLSDGTASGANRFTETPGALLTSAVGITAPQTQVVELPLGSSVRTGSLVYGEADFFEGTVRDQISPGSTLQSAADQLNAQFGPSLIAQVSTDGALSALVFTDFSGNPVFVQGSLDVQSATGDTPGVDFTNSSVRELTAATARSVLTSASTAIADVAFQRGEIGSSVNELIAASGVASTESVDLTSAESTIRSTNFAQATSDLAKYQVLSQTGISAIAQANSVQQEVLKLLQ